jgi:RNA polymerase sigma factor (sigma-70 family)
MSRSGVEDVAVVLPVDKGRQAAGLLPVTADALCQAYAARVYKFAQLISADSANAEDLAQDALERAIRGLQTFDSTKGEIEGWLWRIVVNAGRNAGRIARRQRLIFEVLVDRWSPEERFVEIGDRLMTEEVIDAIRALSRRHRAVLALRFGADLSYRQVGQALGVSEAGALMATRRALAILRNLLSEGVQPK